MSDTAMIVAVLAVGFVLLRFVWDILKNGWGTPEPATRAGIEARGRGLSFTMLAGLGLVCFGLYLLWYYSTYGSLR